MVPTTNRHWAAKSCSARSVADNSRAWAITSYFTHDDPPGLKRRLQTYREFRKRLTVPLATVELSRDGAFDLGPADADLLIRVCGDAELWQKERLLNIALESLPRDCDTVAWVDCDVVFARPDWLEAARALLDRYALVQPFRRLHHLAGPSTAAGVGQAPVACTVDSVAFRYQEGTFPTVCFQIHGGSQMHGYSPGMVWVAKRSLLVANGLYDALILGSGDKIAFTVGCGHTADAAEAFRLSPRHREHLQGWATSFAKEVRGRISYIDGDIYHLWHGDLNLRGYKNRYHGFDRFNFDPDRDIALNRDRVWRWNSDKPALHAYLREYFERRRGRLASATALSKPPAETATARQFEDYHLANRYA